MFKRLRAALTFLCTTCFNWRSSWRQVKTMGGWYSEADDEGNVRIVRGGKP